MRERARFQFPHAPNAGAWLTTPPFSALGLHLEMEEFQSCVKYRLGFPIYDAHSNCPYCKNGVIDIYGEHSLTCGGRRDNIHRHDRLRDKVFSSCVSANLSPLLEKKNLSCNNQSRTADVFLPSWTQGKPEALDVTVVSSLQSTIIANAAVTPGYALTYADGRKLAAHDADCREAEVNFLPLSIEVLGCWSETSRRTINKIACLGDGRNAFAEGSRCCDQPIDLIHFNPIYACERKYDNYPFRLINDNKCLYLISAEFSH